MAINLQRKNSLGSIQFSMFDGKSNFQERNVLSNQINSLIQAINQTSSLDNSIDDLICKRYTFKEELDLTISKYAHVKTAMVQENCQKLISEDDFAYAVEFEPNINNINDQKIKNIINKIKYKIFNNLDNNVFKHLEPKEIASIHNYCRNKVPDNSNNPYDDINRFDDFTLFGNSN